MGYNTAFLMIEGVTTAEAEDLFEAADLFTPAGEIDFEEAASQSLHPDLALGAVGGWAIFWNPNAQILEGDAPLDFSRGRRALGATLGSVGSLYGFSYYVDGALKRGIVYEGNEVLEEVGATLPEEADLSAPAWGPDEDFVFEITARLTGVSLDDLLAARYQLLKL